MKTNIKTFALALFTAAVAISISAGEALDPPPFGFPFTPASHRMTAAYDLQRGTGRADWTGWIEGDPTAGNGHAYDDHSGTDLGMVNGTPLHAIANGTVSSSYESFPTDDHSGGGNYIIVNYPHGGDTYLVNNWHLDYLGVLVSNGSSVTKGQHIANSNNTGNSTGPHLHYGIQKSNGAALYSCGFYHGWWESGEFYYGDTRPCLVFIEVLPAITSLNCREGNTTGYNIITSLQGGRRFVSSQHNNWWRIFLPMPPAKAVESRTSGGSLNAPAYTESGTWTNDAAKSLVADQAGDANHVTRTAAGSRYSTFATTGGADSAVFNFTAPQRGNYKIFATWPKSANAANVNYQITHAAGTANVPIDQVGYYTATGGSGTKANPYIIATNHYVADHTSIGGEDTWQVYSCATGLPQEGPERVYQFTVLSNTNVTVTVDHTSYPTKDIDIHLLSALNTSSCLARADWTFTYSLTPGTYYISADSYGTGSAGDNRATNYTIIVKFDEDEPFPDSWVLLGEYSMVNGGNYTVTVQENAVTGKINGAAEGRVYADAIKFVPVITNRSGFISNDASFTARVNTSTTPISSVVVHVDKNTRNDTRDIDDYIEVPIFADRGTVSGNSSAVVGKAVTGQRLVCTGRTVEGWYRVDLSNGTAATEGWLSGDHLIIYEKNAAPIIEDSGVTNWLIH